MHLIATSDLHGNPNWFDWLRHKATIHPIIVLSGDLIDADGDRLEQVRAVWAWVKAVTAKGSMVLACEGNHDILAEWPTPGFNFPSADAEHRALACESWVAALGVVYPQCVAYGTKLVKRPEPVVLTSLPFGQDYAVNKRMMEEGRRIRSQAQTRTFWIVAHHQPPVGQITGGDAGSAAFTDLIEEFQPNMVFCGHDHTGPQLANSCMEMIGGTRVFNAGCSTGRDHPCHVLVNTKTLKHLWAR